MVEFVYEFGGDVLKFAGDALICLFEGEDADETLLRAKTCSVKLLAFFAEAQKATDTGLSQIQIHGGMAEGYLKCMHLGTEEIVPGNWWVVLSAVCSVYLLLISSSRAHGQHVHGRWESPQDRGKDDGQGQARGDLRHWHAHANHSNDHPARDQDWWVESEREREREREREGGKNQRAFVPTLI